MRRIPAAVLLSLLVAGCATGPNSRANIPDNFGEANRQTMMAQVIDPTPVYETTVPESSGEHAAQAVERYRKGEVKKPDRVKTTNAGAGTSAGGGGGSGGN
jgi:type IV pilus biogenesis protein CpaD/CtpE